MGSSQCGQFVISMPKIRFPNWAQLILAIEEAVGGLPSPSAKFVPEFSAPGTILAWRGTLGASAFAASRTCKN